MLALSMSTSVKTRYGTTFLQELPVFRIKQANSGPIGIPDRQGADLFLQYGRQHGGVHPKQCVLHRQFDEFPQLVNAHCSLDRVQVKSGNRYKISSKLFTNHENFVDLLKLCMHENRLAIFLNLIFMLLLLNFGKKKKCEGFRLALYNS